VILTTDEITIYDLCEQGDRKSQMQVYDQYAKGMYHVALRIVQNSHLAEDIMQDSMITAFTKMNQWNRTATFGAWLKRIVVNNSLSHLRKNGKYDLINYDDVAYEMEQTTDEDIDIEAAGITADQVLEVLKTLKDSYREILTLSLIEGMDNDEISEILGISNGMCRTTISRAKESLRKQMQRL
jgi:RNA polymerase sigma-70 factor (ECF subfamily)